MLEEERTIVIQKDKKEEVAEPEIDEPEIAENILPDKIFDEARSSIIVP